MSCSSSGQGWRKEREGHLDKERREGDVGEPPPGARQQGCSRECPKCPQACLGGDPPILGSAPAGWVISDKPPSLSVPRPGHEDYPLPHRVAMGSPVCPVGGLFGRGDATGPGRAAAPRGPSLSRPSWSGVGCPGWSGHTGANSSVQTPPWRCQLLGANRFSP